MSALRTYYGRASVLAGRPRELRKHDVIRTAITTSNIKDDNNQESQSNSHTYAVRKRKKYT